VLENDPAMRLLGVVLAEDTSAERRAAWTRYMVHDLPDFAGWCDRVRAGLGRLYPADVRLVDTQDELLAALADADGLIVESLKVSANELDAGPRLGVVQKFGLDTRNIDRAACAARGLPVLTQRRRVNVACAEQTLAMMLAFAKKLDRIAGLISVEQLEAAGYTPAQFDRRFTPNAGWAGVTGLRMLYESTLGILGLGEIGRELAPRAAAFGMRVMYYQRTRLTADEERAFQATYMSLEQLLDESDWLSVQLPLTSATRSFLDRGRLAQMKPGAYLINTARAEVVERDAVLDALRSGRLAGFALDAQYEEPGREDDELLNFRDVLLTPHTAAQPRFNALKDCEEILTGVARALHLSS
jgi:phosphoglycerate dehydrogenase-like enzyme